MCLSVDAKALCASLIRQHSLPETFNETVNRIYLPLAEIIVNKVSSSPLLVCINGAQGSGKSTLTGFLECILEAQFDARVAAFSLDDFYLTRRQRQLLAADVHPLLSTRGVPGTHDVPLLETVLDNLLNQRSCKIPRFDKLTDERCSNVQWAAVTQAVDIILLEGWCVNSPVQHESELIDPVNELEKNEDSDGVWRHFANHALKEYHQRIFEFSDFDIMLDSFDFSRVYEWRLLQEKKLQAKSMQPGSTVHLMDKHVLKRFIQHFERITRHTLRHLPAQSDLVLPVADDHTITSICHK